MTATLDNSDFVNKMKPTKLTDSIVTSDGLIVHNYFNTVINEFNVHL
jgi:hypothetical protein